MAWVSINRQYMVEMFSTILTSIHNKHIHKDTYRYTQHKCCVNKHSQHRTKHSVFTDRQPEKHDPLAAPNVDIATEIGMIIAADPRTRDPHVCNKHKQKTSCRSYQKSSSDVQNMAKTEF